MPHVHAHAHHAVTEPPEEAPPDGPPDRRERLTELGAVLMLSLATLATAWSGYQAARWSGEQSQHYARASTMRIKSQAQTTQAGQLRIDDLLLFNEWLDARAAGDDRLATIYRRRFRPAFRPAFRAWVAQESTGSVPSPLYMPQYRPQEAARAVELDARADQLYREGTAAKSTDDHYVLSTVFFAAVLFLAGISLRLEWRRLRLAVLGIAAAMLLTGIGYVMTLPVA
jgi:hypothetical protein